jgi:hypothetical protein
MTGSGCEESFKCGKNNNEGELMRGHLVWGMNWLVNQWFNSLKAGDELMAGEIQLSTKLESEIN